MESSQPRRTVIAGRYELDDFPLARGGMGEVWAGYDQQLGRRVAVKFVRFPDGPPDEELTRRFIRESRITARLQHPGVPAVYDAAAVTEPGLHHGQLYMVMQLVEGVSVADLLAEQGPLPQEWAALIVAQAAAVLAAAHAESLVHRDLKPSNLMLCPDATVKVLDFGLAAALEPSDLSRITSTGHVPGTPHYMAPEQLLYGVTSAHSDLYSLGCVLHELLTGRRPFSGATVFALARQHEETAPTPLRELRPDADPALERLVLDLLEKHPDRRPADATELYRRLLPFIGNPAPLPGVVDLTPGPVRLYAGAVALVGTTPPVQTSAPRKKPSRKDGPPQDAEPRPAPAPSEPALEDELEQVRRQAAELVAEARYEQAAELLSRQVEKSGRALGFDHEQTLNARLELADVLFEGGEYQRAASAYQGLVDDLAAYHGRESEPVLRCRLQEATCHAVLGETGVALREMESLLADQRRILGEDHERTLDLRRQIGMLHMGAGDTTRAHRILSDLLADIERLHGPSHPLAESVRNLLGDLPDDSKW